jgi:hypothetical protein
MVLFSGTVQAGKGDVAGRAGRSGEPKAAAE